MSTANTIAKNSGNIQAIPVSFQGSVLYVVQHDSQPYTPMKPISEGMGLSWQGQHAKLSSNSKRWGIKEILIPSVGGNQEAICLPLRKLPGWLMSIHPNKVKAEIREKVVAYQNECDDVLWRHWEEKQNNLYRIATEVLTPAQQRALQEAVSRRAGELPAEKRGMAFTKLWGGIKSHFQVGMYKDLSPTQYDAALSYIDSYEWEVLDKEETVSAFSIAPVVYTKPDGYEESRWVDRGAPRNDKTIKRIIAELMIWGRENLPRGEVAESFIDAIDDIKQLQIACWTEIDEALSSISRGVWYLHRWQGRGGRIGNTEISKR